MTGLKVSNLDRLRRTCVYLGVALQVIALLLFASTLLGIVEIEEFALFGQSGLRSLASIGVAGCLLAAIGYYDE